jgi:zinc protease
MTGAPVPPGAALPSAASLNPSRVVLANGVVVTARETRKTPAVAINVAVRAGTIDDPPALPGAMHLLSRVIDRGTERRSAADMAEALDALGMSLSVQVNRHLTSFLCTCLSEDIEPALDLLGDVVMTPAVPEEELAHRKTEVVTAIRQDEDNPAVRAVEGLMALLYGDDHPYGRPARGSADVVMSMTRDDLRRLHAARFAPGDVSVVIVGDVAPARAADLVNRALGSWHRPVPLDRPIESPPPAPSRRRRVVPMMNKAQADIAYGFVAMARSDPDYYACYVLNNILGQYALGGRLGDSIRERQGMAYYVASVFDATRIAGPLLIRAGVSPANVDRAVQSIDEELTAIARDGVTAKELTESRQYLIGSMPRALETNAGIAIFLQTAEFFGLGLDHDRRLPGLIGAVTLEQVNAVARRILDPARAALVVAGPYQGN